MKVLELCSLGSLRSSEIHPFEFRYVEPGEWLQEERQPGAPCHVSSDEDYCMECCCKRL